MFSTGNAHVPTGDGYFVSEDQQRIAEIVQDYEPTLELVWIPPDRRGNDDKPFAVVCHPTNGQPSYFVLFADQCDERILSRLWAADNKHHNVLTELEVNEAAHKALELKRKEDELELRQDLMRSAIQSPLNTYRYENPITGEKKVIRN